MTEVIPTEEDWGDYTSDLDWDYAHRIFAGKANDEVQADFKRNAMGRAEEFHYMPDVPFRYYIRGFAQYVMGCGDDRLNDSEAASSFLWLIERTLGENPERLLSVLNVVVPVLDHIADCHERFDHGSSEIFRFQEQVEAIKRDLPRS